MAEITLHSGSFVDRNDNEITISFYKKTSTPVMTVEPTALSFIAAGESKTLRVSGYSGTLTLNNPAAWLSYTSSTRSGVRTYTLTAAQNATTTIRRATLTLTDANNSITVEAVQAGTLSSLVINPSYITMEAAGGTTTASLSWSGGYTPTYSGKASWVNLSTSTSGNTMTLTVSLGQNTGEDRTNDIVFTNGISSATLHITQNAASVVYVSPNEISYDAEGGLWNVSVYWTGNVTPTYTINYDSGSDWLVQRSSPIQGDHELTYTFRAVANETTSIRSASIVFTNGSVSATVTVNQAGTTPVTISVDKPVIDNVVAGGGTDVVTVTYNGQGYITPSGMPSWIDVRYKDAPTTTTVRYDFIISQNTGSARSATITFTGSLGGTATTTVNQVAAAVVWTVSPSSITGVSYQGDTYNVSFTGTPSIGMGYEVDPVSVDWVTANISSLSAATITVGANQTSSSRNATVKFYKYDDHSIYVTVSISQNGMPTPWTVVPSSIPNATASGLSYQVSISGAPSGGMGYDVIYGSGNNWITITNFSNSGCTLTTSANTDTSSRSATVKFYDLDDQDHYITLSITQDGTAVAALSVRDVSMSFIAAGERKSTIVENIVGTLTHTEPNWITLALSGTGGTRMVSVHAAENSSTAVRSGSVTFDDDRLSPVSMAVSQDGASAVLTVTPTSLSFVAEGENKTVTATNISGVLTYSTSYSGGDTNWIMYSTSGSGSTKTVMVIADANTSRSSRSATAIFNDDNNNPVSVTITQEGAQAPVSSIAVSPSSIDFPYTNDAETLTVSGVPSGGFSTSISYNTGASGWLGTTNTAYNIIVTASGTTYPSSRTATLTVTNASVPSDSVAIPITQAGNPQVLSVTPNAWNYPASLSYHNFEITYNASGSVTYSVAYDRQPGEEEIDWLEVELVEHNEGSETWIYSIDVGPNNTGSGRAAMVTFEGDGGGADEVSVYQQP